MPVHQNEEAPLETEEDDEADGTAGPRSGDRPRYAKFSG